MAQIETWLKCDLQNTVEVVPLKGHLFSADDHGNRIGVEITNAGLPHPVSGTLVLYGVRHDGVTVVTRVNVTNSNRPSIELASDFYNVVGPIQLVLRLLDGNEETVLAACTTYVYRTTSSQLIDSGSAVPDMETLIARIDDCERAAASANTAATNAQSQVDAAATAASAAQTAATNAQTAATAAQTAATGAASDASDAQAAATAAQTAATTASTAATTAQTAATNAASSAATAATDAATAQSQVATAQQAATTAQTQAASAQSAAISAGAAATSAQTSAASAANSASDAASSAQQASDQATSANNLASQLSSTFSQLLPTLVNGGEVRGDALYLLHDDQIVAGPFSGFGGGGGGGGGSSSVTMTFTATNGEYALTASKNQQVVLGLTWSSLEEDDSPTGNGILKLTIDNVVKFSRGVAQGSIQQDVTNYLHDGDNTLVFQMTDAYGNKRTRSFSVTVINLGLTSTFDDSVDQTGPIEFAYIPSANMEKTMHFLIDGTQVSSETVTSYGRQRTKVLPQQMHGPHTLVVYYTISLNGETVYSNILHYEITCIEYGNDNTIITSPYNETSINQYSTINVPYRVYNPMSQLSDVTISVNGIVVNTLTGVDRTRQTFSYRMDTSGTTTISIASGNAVKLIVLTVNAVTIDAEAETEGLKLHLSSYGRSNNEADPATWTFNQNGTTIASTFSGFNWVNDGWVLDDDGITVMRVSGEARITVPYQPFATDKRTSGFTVEIDFATKDVRNYDSPIISCMNGGRGFVLTSQKFTLSSEGSSISMQFKENEHVRASFVVEKRTGLRLIYCYINGIMSGVTRYPTSDNFAQVTPQGISIGSNNATIDIYTIRIYDNDLGMKQIEDNWIADTPDGNLMLTRFARNNIRDDSGEVAISKLPTDLPYMIISCPELSQYKGDKKQCSGTYVDPINSAKSFTFEECEINVQGTSSQYYSRKNYTMKFNGGFTNSNGVTEAKYKLREDSIAEKQFVMKADVASSEGANNVELVRLYNDNCTYRTPAQQANSKVRQGIDGFPIVIFWNNSDTNEMTFLGKYNFNNAKGTKDTYGFVDGDESWEMRNNTSDRVLYKSDDFDSMGTDEFGNVIPAWQGDFECRFPSDEYTNYLQLKELLTWVKSTDPTTATNNALAETADFGETITEIVNGEQVVTPITYSTDSAAYRRAKFKAELSNYVEVQSAMFYYLFTELFLMVDSRAKNSFPSFIGEAIVQETEEEP